MRKFCMFFLLFLFSAALFADDDDEKLKLAVMEFEDRSGNLSEKTLSDATEYIRGAFVASNKFIVIAKERQDNAMIKQMKKESYKACNDKNCQIPLGQALSADTILRTTINFFGGIYTITSELIDLAKEATVVGAKQKFDGSEQAFMEALDKIADKIAGADLQIDDEPAKVPEIQQVKPEEPKPEEQKPAEQENNVTENKPAEEKPAENIQENQPEKEIATQKQPVEKKPAVPTYHPYKTAGISLMVVGAVVAAAGIATFHVLSDKEYKKYDDMTTVEAATEYVNDGWREEGYLKETRRYLNKSNTFRYLEIASGTVGGALLVTGVVLTAIKKKKPDEKISLSNISVVPANNGFYAGLGFEF
ncbi:hypothetical protein J5690_09130 [bacterium]|nr:hypothetical protein [bacterium]